MAVVKILNHTRELSHLGQIGMCFVSSLFLWFNKSVFQTADNAIVATLTLTPKTFGKPPIKPGLASIDGFGKVLHLNVNTLIRQHS